MTPDQVLAVRRILGLYLLPDRADEATAQVNAAMERAE